MVVGGLNDHHNLFLLQNQQISKRKLTQMYANMIFPPRESITSVLLHLNYRNRLQPSCQ